VGFNYYNLMKELRIALAQINPTVGDLEGNAGKIIRFLKQARRLGADIVAFPELAVTGYPPEDLLLKPSFLTDNVKALRKIRRETEGITAGVGFVDVADDMYNAAAVLSNKRTVDVYRKVFLPNYGPFDEVRYFQAGTRVPVYRTGEVLVGVTICEDMWHPEGPARLQALAGAELVININSSPYTMEKAGKRESMIATRALDSSVIVAYLNAVGGQDELVFDGGSIIYNERGELVARGKQFEEDLVVADLDIEGVFLQRLHDPRHRQQARALEEGDVDVVDLPAGKKARTRKMLPRKKVPALMETREEVWSALTLGLSDYMKKNRFRGGIVGLSGGVDSALVAALAVDALGKGNVTCLFMPSRYTSPESGEDSRRLAKNLGVKLIEIPIDPVFDRYLESLTGLFKGRKPDTAEENLQARIRGNLLMAASNKFGWIVLTTGNKSEMSVGYATLYGDMAGGFAVIKDVPKTLVYDLARWRNETAGKELIPGHIMTKEPTAELRAGQKDTDSLPPYEVLDPVLKAYIEEESSFEEIVSFYGWKPGDVRRVIGMVDSNEYKRRQSPPGIKITGRAFGKDRRFPITNRYRDR
jgi:NAD+ synthase (glutamine-hydrolysing)